MKCEYLQTKTKAFFSVQSISEFRNEAVSDSQHKWFTILICSNATGELAIDNYKLTLNTPQAIFITPGNIFIFQIAIFWRVMPFHLIKNLLKNLLIRSNRPFRAQMSIGDVDDTIIDFVRKFSDLVEKHFKEIKQVEIYADMMNIA